jgi:hypothetical protein
MGWITDLGGQWSLESVYNGTGIKFSTPDSIVKLRSLREWSNLTHLTR